MHINTMRANNPTGMEANLRYSVLSSFGRQSIRIVNCASFALAKHPQQQQPHKRCCWVSSAGANQRLQNEAVCVCVPHRALKRRIIIMLPFANYDAAGGSGICWAEDLPAAALANQSARVSCALHVCHSRCTVLSANFPAATTHLWVCERASPF